MNTGQTMITFGALVLLTIVVLNMHRSINNAEFYLNDTRFGLEAIAIASSLIEEISQFPFDQASWDTTSLVKFPTDFTLPNDLGPDAGETSHDLFNDVDDFHNYSRLITTEQNEYNLHCSVCYVNENNPDVPLNGRSFFKKITITISNSISNDTTRMNYIHGFWFFN
jgi:hypothetical protein